VLRVFDLTRLSKVGLRSAFCIGLAINSIFLQRYLLSETLELATRRLLSSFSLDSRNDLGLIRDLVSVAIDVCIFMSRFATALHIELIVRVLSHLVFFVVVK
jgi:hypothetical protein